MGTNYYVAGYLGEDDKHIGKRSSAGHYCWDCGITLCVEGKEKVHFSGVDWHNKCPLCGLKAEKEKLEDSAAGRELGFNRKPFSKKSGVASCSSFSWAIPPDELDNIKPSRLDAEKYFTELPDVVDEYGVLYTLDEFKKLLEECPLQYTDMVGHVFS